MRSMQTIDDIFQAFGGLKEFSAITGLKYSTVVAMRNRDSLPVDHWKLIEAHAKARGIEGLTRHSICDIVLATFKDPVLEKAKPKRPRAAERVAS